MSTKTSIKRIALVAVSALGFGVLASITPANAASGAEGSYTATAINAVQVTASPVVGTAVSINIGATIGDVAAAGAAETRVVTINSAITSYPSGGGTSLATAASAGGGSALAFTGGTTTTAADSAALAGVCKITSGSNAAITGATKTASATQGLCSTAFTPTKAGTYVITVWFDKNQDNIFESGELSNTVSISVGSAASGVTEYANTSNTAASVTNNLVGTYVSSTNALVTAISGRIGVPVGFIPGYTVYRNAGYAGNSAALSGQKATLVYSVTNPAGTAVTTYTAAGGTTADGGIQYVSGTSQVIATTASAGKSSLNNPGSAAYFTPATAGTYTINVYHDQNGDGLVSAYEAISSTTVTVAADALPSITFTTYGTNYSGDTLGVLEKVCLTNGATKVSLGLSESLSVTGGTFTNVSSLNSAGNLDMGATSGTTLTLTSANFNGSGCAWFNVKPTSFVAAGVTTLTATIVGGTAAGDTGSVSFTSADSTTYPADTTTAGLNVAIANGYTSLGVQGSSIAAVGADPAGAASANWNIKASTATTVLANIIPGTTSKAYTGSWLDTAGLVTGGGVWTSTAPSYPIWKATSSTATSTTKVGFSVALPATTKTTALGTLTINLKNSSGTAVANTVVVYATTAAATTLYVDPAASAATYSVRAAAASTNKFVVTELDQFGNALPNITITPSISGRNSTTVLPAAITDANGNATFSLTDTYTGTLLTSDTITLTPSAGSTGTITVNYAAYLPAATITMTTPDSATATATGIAGSVTSDIYAQDGAENGLATIKVVLKDANGATLPAGVPVVFSDDSATANFLSTNINQVTGSDGSVTAYIYAWKNGNVTVTATAPNGVKATGIVYFKQADCTAGSNCAEARTVAATAAGNTVTATVSDRYGNPIKGVTLTATRAGTGTFGGASSTTATTDKNGQVQFVLSGGSADVTVAFATTTFGQSYATKGYVDAGITALTAYIAGTVAISEVGVGASFDAAGVNSVTVAGVTDASTSDSIDAANEATDAANAATDAANAAAEAADAATAAAQDAQAAVADLAAQVATLIAGIKAQITALTNLVIKIQKKVKA